MHKDFWGWSLENNGSGTVETKYIVEYVDDSKTWERICFIDEHYSEIEPLQESWELYSKNEYDNVSEAMTFYMWKFVSDNCYDIKMLEQVFVNGEMVLEQPIEPKSTVMNSMRISVNREMEDRMHKAEMKVKELEEANCLYEEFINKYKAKEAFKHYIENRKEAK